MRRTASQSADHQSGRGRCQPHGENHLLGCVPILKSYGIPGRARLFEVVQRAKEVNNGRLRDAIRNKTAVYKDGVPSLSAASYDATALAADFSLEVSYLVAPPRMTYYEKVSRQIYGIYLKYIAPEDIVVYSIDEVFIDATAYLTHYKMSAHDLAMTMIREVLYTTGITATAGIGTNLYLPNWQWTSLLSTLPRTRTVSASQSLMKNPSGICSGITSRSPTFGRSVPAPSADGKAWHPYDGRAGKSQHSLS